MTETESDVEFPKEISESLASFHESLENAETVLEPILGAPDPNFADLPPLEKARWDITTAFCVTSLFYAYLQSKGIDVKEHPIKQEIARIREYMTRLKLVEEKDNAPKVNVPVAKRMLRNALWEPKQKDGQSSSNS